MKTIFKQVHKFKLYKKFNKKQKNKAELYYLPIKFNKKWKQYLNEIDPKILGKEKKLKTKI